MLSPTTEFVYLPVPTRRLGAMLAVLRRELEAESGPPGGAPPSLPGAWSAEEVVRLAQSANAMTRAILDLGSRTAGKPVSIRDAEKEAGLEYPAARAQLAGLTRLLKARFGREDSPFQVLTRGEGHVFYVVDEAVARHWKHATRG